MKLKLWIAATASFLVLATHISSQAQTASELNEKYGPPVISYKIRPDLLMTPTYTKGGQVCKMVVERRHISDNGLDLRLKLSEDEVAMLIEELVPAAEWKVRGKADGLVRITGGPLVESIYDFENVSVSLAEGTLRDWDNGGSFLIIQWKHRSCR
jgi:hypothetical protein